MVILDINCWAVLLIKDNVFCLPYSKVLEIPMLLINYLIRITLNHLEL